MTDDATGWEFDLSFFGGRFRFRRTTHANTADIEVCTTRIVRSGRGLPWDERIAIHPLPDGKLEIRLLRADGTEGEHTC